MGEQRHLDERALQIVHDKLIEKARIKAKLRLNDRWDFWLEARGILEALAAAEPRGEERE